jgi:hypothetical protein
MAKSNPLFVDSTLLRGDSIGTQIELHNVLLFDGEAIYLVLLTENDEEICMPLTPTSETAFEVFVRLIHQRPVKFYFGIAKDGELLYRSEDYALIALYALIEESGAGVSSFPEDAGPGRHIGGRISGFIDTGPPGPPCGNDQPDGNHQPVLTTVRHEWGSSASDPGAAGRRSHEHHKPAAKVGLFVIMWP